MDNYRSVLEVLKWTLPQEVLQAFGHIDRCWHRAAESEELWAVFCDSSVVQTLPASCSQKSRYRHCRQTTALALFSPHLLRLLVLEPIGWVSVSLECETTLNKSSAWAPLPSNAAFICCGGLSTDRDRPHCTANSYKVAVTGVVEVLGLMKTGRKWHGLLVFGRVCYAFGGSVTTAAGDAATAACEQLPVYQRSAQWVEMRGMISARCFFNPCLYELEVYLLGGGIPECEVFAPATEQFTLLPFTLTPHCTTAAVQNSELLIFSGSYVYFWKKGTGEMKTRSFSYPFHWGNSPSVVHNGACWVAQGYDDSGVLKIDLTDFETQMFPEEEREYCTAM